MYIMYAHSYFISITSTMLKIVLLQAVRAAILLFLSRVKNSGNSLNNLSNYYICLTPMCTKIIKFKFEPVLLE